MKKKNIIFSILLLIISMPFAVLAVNGEYEITFNEPKMCTNPNTDLVLYTYEKETVVVGANKPYLFGSDLFFHEFEQNGFFLKNWANQRTFTKETNRRYEDKVMCPYTAILTSTEAFPELGPDVKNYYAYALRPINENMKFSDAEISSGNQSLAFALKHLLSTSGLVYAKENTTDFNALNNPETAKTYSYGGTTKKYTYQDVNFAIKALLYSFYREEYGYPDNDGIEYMYLQQARSWLAEEISRRKGEPNKYLSGDLTLSGAYEELYNQIKSNMEGVPKPAACSNNGRECQLKNIPTGAESLFLAGIDGLARYKQNNNKAVNPRFNYNFNTPEKMTSLQKIVNGIEYFFFYTSNATVTVSFYDYDYKEGKLIYNGIYSEQQLYKINKNIRGYLEASFDGGTTTFDLKENMDILEEYRKRVKTEESQLLSGKLTIYLNVTPTNKLDKLLEEENKNVDDSGINEDAKFSENISISFYDEDPNKLSSGIFIETYGNTSEEVNDEQYCDYACRQGFGKGNGSSWSNENLIFLYGTSGKKYQYNGKFWGYLKYGCNPISALDIKCDDNNGSMFYSDIGIDEAITGTSKQNIVKCIINKYNSDVAGNSYKLNIGETDEENSFYRVYCKEDVNFGSLPGNIIQASGRYINLHASMTDTVDCYTTQLDYSVRTEKQQTDILNAYAKYMYYYHLYKEGNINQFNVPGYGKVTINYKSVSDFCGISCEVSQNIITEYIPYSSASQPFDATGCDIETNPKGNIIKGYRCPKTEYKCSQKSFAGSSSVPKNASYKDGESTSAYTIYAFGDTAKKTPITTVGGYNKSASTNASCNEYATDINPTKTDMYERYECGVIDNQASTCQKIDVASSLKSDNNLKKYFEDAEKNLIEKFSALKDTLNEFNTSLGKLDEKIQFNFNPSLKYEYTYNEGKTYSGKMILEEGSEVVAEDYYLCSDNVEANYDCKTTNTKLPIDYENELKNKGTSNLYTNATRKKSTDELYGCYRETSGKITCGYNIAYSTYTNANSIKHSKTNDADPYWYRVIDVKYYHKKITYNAKYNEERMYYTSYNQGTIFKKPSSYDIQNNNLTKVEGLPLGFNLYPGKKYQYKIILDGIGQYFGENNPDGNVSSKGRIFSNDRNSAIYYLEGTSDEISNEYSCVYQVDNCDPNNPVDPNDPNCPTPPVIPPDPDPPCDGACTLYCKEDPSNGVVCSTNICNGCKIVRIGELQLDYRIISPIAINPNNRTMGANWRWTTSNYNTNLIAKKAYLTINEIEKSATSFEPNDLSNDYTLQVEMTPEMNKYIRNYNDKSESYGLYDDNSLDCYDYKDANVTHENVMCYSTFIDELAGNFSGQIKAPGRPASSDRKKMTWSKDISNNTVYNNYWTLIVDTQLASTSSYGGPSWK